MKGLEHSISINTAVAHIERSFKRSLRLGTRPDSFMLLGQPGVGKTASMAEMAQANNWGYAAAPMGCMEPPDLMGLMSKAQDTRYFTYLAPEWLREAIHGTRPVIVNFDDVAAGQTQVQKAMFKVLNEHQISTDTPVRNEVMFVLTANRVEDNAGAQQILRPIRDGRVRSLQVHADLKEWLARCGDWGTHFVVRAWLSQQSQFFTPKATAASFITPCPRTHVKLSNAQHEADEATAALTFAEAAACEGDEAAAQYLQFLRVRDDMVDPDEVLANPKMAINSDNLDAFVMLAKALEARLEQNAQATWRPVLRFANRKDLGKGDLRYELGEKAVLEANRQANFKIIEEVFGSDEFQAFKKNNPLIATSDAAKRLAGGR